MGSSSSKPQPQKQTVFKSARKQVYRIPALFYERESETLLAFAEQRKTKKDTDSEKLVMKMGKMKTDDSGKMKIEWSEESKPVDEAHIEGHRPMNPCPLYEKTSKTLFLFFICIKGHVSDWDQIRKHKNETRLCYITSTDVGQTWTAVTDLTDELLVTQKWDTCAVGPGHGVQTESGRLIVPVYGFYRCPSGEFWGDNPYALYVYSDNKGRKWQLSDKVEKLSLECQVAEVTDDKGKKFIYCNARSNKGSRVEAVSSEDSTGFTILTSAKLKETDKGCQGSVVSFPAQSEGAPADMGQDQSPNKWLLYSHPTSPSSRFDLGVYLNRSLSTASAWSKPWIINSGASGYSDLAYIDDGHFACLIERGKGDKTEIASAVFSYSDVKQGTAESSPCVILKS